MKTINSINSIPLHYARLTNHPYGTRGEQRNFSIDETFLATLKAAFKEIFENCPFGTPEVITCAGIFVNKPGQHGHGRAFDLDAIFWQNETLVTLNFLHQKELYIAVESFLRKHFGIVLNYLYPHHKDHWHIDTSVAVDYNTTAKSETLYVQMALKYIYGKNIIVDGIWGNQTQTMVKEVFNRLQIATPITTKVNYLKFLDITGKVAFKLCEKKNSPLELLDNLNDVIDDLSFNEQQTVREALNSFLDHDETSQWLRSFTGNTGHHLDQIIDSVLT